MAKEEKLKSPPEVSREIEKIEKLWEEIIELSKRDSKTRRLISLYAGMILVDLSHYMKQIKCLRRKIIRESEKIRRSVIVEDEKKLRKKSHKIPPFLFLAHNPIRKLRF